ncbi:hypothetical protein DSM19430T_21480 [Desulfovibrio psychrotolerans]|uniref:Uncharacterized protein n=1 Tax=Desulfovibrio psychrotolerans TaxID=415242 RepID=A0A7J0BWX0_9BACT|nr:hypothetical protein DSM19430T_21480 [Desulfovibrio psychrotolerans]
MQSQPEGYLTSSAPKIFLMAFTDLRAHTALNPTGNNSLYFGGRNYVQAGPPAWWKRPRMLPS